MVAPARSAMARWAGGGIMRSSLATRYQLGLMRQAGSVMVPWSASTPHGTCASAMKAAAAAGRSAANALANFALSRNRNPSDRRHRRPRRRVGDQRADGLPGVGREGGDVDEA